jgi:hypothetical protein
MLTGKSWLLCWALLLGIPGIACGQTYEAGQVWSYKTRPQEKDSTLMVLRVESTSNLGQVIFIGVKDVRVQHPSGRVLSAMSPLPFAKTALDKSVIKMLGKSDKLMSSSFGYQKWKDAQFAGRKPPVYAKPVAEIIDGLENGYIGIPKK